MTLREIFDKVKSHLLSQGKQALLHPEWTEEDGNGKSPCAYRGPDGSRCAVGCLIKDEAYDPDIENRPATHSAVIRALDESGVLPERDMTCDYYASERAHAASLLSALQDVHDWKDVPDWPEDLSRVEARFFPEVK